MNSSWKNWCRLCGNTETLSKIDPEIEEIIKALSSQISIQHKIICRDCNNYLQDFRLFLHKSRALQEMFDELENVDILFEQLNSDFNYEKNINEIRTRFGLNYLEDYHEKDDEILLFDDSALEISKMDKMESDIHDIGAPEKDFSDNEDEGDGINQISETIELDDSNEASSEVEELNKFTVQTDSDLNDELQEDAEEEDLYLQNEKRSRKHMKKKSKEEEKVFDFICHICQEEFQKMSQLANHCRKSHNCLPQVQCYCGKTLGTWKRLLMHKQKHFPEKFAYECKECKMLYKIKSSYLNHMKQKHGPDAQKFVCSQCARCFKDTRTLISHEKTHWPMEKKLTYPCEICEKKFVNKNSLKSHIMSVHENASLYTCEHCGKSFSTKSNLKSHLYSHSDEKNVQCDICSARFKNMDSLRKHKKTHMEKTHECKICGSRYRNRNNLKAHMVCHSDVKAFRCSFCPNEYKRSKELKCHMNLHTGERPYQCQFCARTFVNGSNCRKHKLKDHPEELAAFEALHGKGKAAAVALQCTKVGESQ